MAAWAETQQVNVGWLSASLFCLHTFIQLQQVLNWIKGLSVYFDTLQKEIGDCAATLLWQAAGNENFFDRAFKSENYTATKLYFNDLSLFNYFIMPLTQLSCKGTKVETMDGFIILIKIYFAFFSLRLWWIRDENSNHVADFLYESLLVQVEYDKAVLLLITAATLDQTQDLDGLYIQRWVTVRLDLF